MVVGGHDRQHAGDPDSVLEGQEIQLSQGPLVDLGRGGIALVLDLVRDEVLDRCHDVVLLNTIDVCDRQLRAQHRILREALEVPTPEGVTVQVHSWREEDPAALLESLPGDDRARPLDDRRVPCRPERGCRGNTDRRRDALMGTGVPTSAVRPVGHLDRRYAESREARGAPVVDPDGERGLLLEGQCARQRGDITREADFDPGIRCWHDEFSSVSKAPATRVTDRRGRACRCRD